MWCCVVHVYGACMYMVLACMCDMSCMMQMAGAIYLYFAVVMILDKLEKERTYDGGDILFGKKNQGEEEKKKKTSLLVIPSASEILKFFQASRVCMCVVCVCVCVCVWCMCVCV
jgi:hypothetical protein